MVPTSKVVEDGLEAPRRQVDLSRWGWLAAGALIGAGVTVLILGVDQGPPGPESTTASDTPGIDEVVDGFADALIGTTRSNGRSLALVTWPQAAPLHELSITVGTSDQATPVSFDSSGRMLATALPTEDSLPGTAGGSVLYAGIPDRASIIDFAVSGYAWHDTSPFSLAYTTFVDDEMLLWVTGPNLEDTGGSLTETSLLARAVGIDGGIVGWGSWGYAVQDEESIVLFDEFGEITGTHPGRFLASSGQGTLAIDDDGVMLLPVGGETRDLAREGLRGEILTGHFSPDGNYLALLTPEEAMMVTLDQETGLTEFGTDPGLPHQVVWSSDSRFLLYPGEGGIVVADTRDLGVEVILTEKSFTGVGVIPGSEL